MNKHALKSLLGIASSIKDLAATPKVDLEVIRERLKVAEAHAKGGGQ